MPIVNTEVPITAASCERMIREIAEKYPFCRIEDVGTTAFQRPISALVIGTGPTLLNKGNIYYLRNDRPHLSFFRGSQESDCGYPPSLG